MMNTMQHDANGTTSTRDYIRQRADQLRARRLAVSKVMIILCGAALVLTAIPLVVLIEQLIVRGVSQISWGFFTQLPQSPTLSAPNAVGGVSNAVVGTLALALYASIMAIPVGVLTGVYLAESDSKFAEAMRIVAQTMAGAPSILMGLFAFSVFVKYMHLGFTALAGAFALAVLMLPVVTISTEIAVRNVPSTLREAGLALGVKPHKVSLRIVIPSALSGIVTGSLLAIARAVGETAPVLLVIGGGYINEWRPLNPVSALPLSIFMGAKSVWPAQRAQVWGIALVLVAFVFILSLTARLWAGRSAKGRK